MSDGVQFKRTLGDVRDLVTTDDTDKWDQIVPVRELTLQQGRLLWPEASINGYDGGLAFSEWAMSQACQRLGMPSGYFKKCPPHLQDSQFNWWKDHEEAQQRALANLEDESGSATSWMIRSKGTLVRGVLSPRYARLDNRQVLDTLLPILKGSRYQVGLVELTAESFHLRLIEPTIWRDVLPSDRLFVGIHLTNSEVGLRAVTVDALVWRLVCSNGLMRKVDGKSLMRQRHIHVAEARFESMLADAISQATAVAAAFIEQMALSIKMPVPDPDAAVDYLGKLWGLPKQTVEYVKFGLHGEREAESLYGLVNAFTSAAQKLPIENRVELESLASVLIDTTSTVKADHDLRQRILTTRK